MLRECRNAGSRRPQRGGEARELCGRAGHMRPGGRILRGEASGKAVKAAVGAGGQGREKGSAETVEVGAHVEGVARIGRLGRREAGRAGMIEAWRPGPTRGTDRQAQAEIAEQRAPGIAAGQEHVRRREVEMKTAASVDGGERVEEPRGEFHPVARRERRSIRQALGEARALDEVQQQPRRAGLPPEKWPSLK